MYRTARFAVAIAVLFALGIAASTVHLSDAATAGAPPFRYVYNSGADQAGAAANGWNLLDVSSKSEADALPAGTQGLVWVGDYNNSSCSWEHSDSTVSNLAASTAGDPKVFGYFFSDEPDPFACPNAPAQHKARSDLIHAADPSTKTVMVVDSNSGAQTISQIPLWKGDADYIGLDPYPCHQGGACNYSWIDLVIAAANTAGLDYWGVMQGFCDGDWRYPTVDELNHMLGQWSGSNESGQMTFAWVWANGPKGSCAPAGNGSFGISQNPPLLAAMAAYNNGAPPPPAPTVPSAPQGLTATGGNRLVSLSWSAPASNGGSAVTGYKVYRGTSTGGESTTPIATNVTATSFRDTRLTNGTTYYYTVAAVNSVGVSQPSAEASATPQRHHHHGRSTGRLP